MLKLTFTFLFIGFISSTATATPVPVTEDQPLVNSDFSAQIFRALDFSDRAHAPKDVKKIKKGGTTTITVADGFECVKISSISLRAAASKDQYFCKMKGNAGWSSFGWNSFGCGGNQRLAKALYAALKIDPSSEDPEAFEAKTIEYNVPDKSGGTERNLLTCMKPTKKAVEMGFRATCQIINAL